MHRHFFRTLPLVAALAFASGWAPAQGTNGTPGADAGAHSDKGGAKADKLSHGDKEFIEEAAKGGMFEVQSGQMAAQKASDAGVKEFANKLVQDHGKANDELKQIAEAKGVKMPDKEKMGDRHEMDKLKKLNGAAFDREFAQHSVKDHQKDIKEFEKATQKVKDPDVKAWAEKQLPVLKEHLAMAQKLAGNNASNTKAAGARSSS